MRVVVDARSRANDDSLFASFVEDENERVVVKMTAETLDW